MGITFRTPCPCGCREIVEATDFGFSATTVTVDACSSARVNDPAVVSSEVRKSRVMELVDKMSTMCPVCGSDVIWCQRGGN